jgi:hypothetical protein
VTSPWLLVTGDVAALVAFGLLGVASHEEAVSVEIVARSIVPFVSAWLVIGGIAGTFGSGARAGNVDPARFLAAWLIAGTIAMTLRAAIFDRELITAFFVIGIAGYGLFLTAWRLAYHRIAGGRHTPASEGA